MAQGEFTKMEIASQAEVWGQTLKQIFPQQEGIAVKLAGLRNRPWIVTGCGSTYYLSQSLASILRQVGVQAWALPGSELALYTQSSLPDDFVLMPVSRSGTTTETLWAIDAYRKSHPKGKVVTITCVPGTPMVEKSDAVLLAPDAQEKSVAQTRSFSSMAVLGQVLAGWLSGDKERLRRLSALPTALKNMLDRAEPLARQIGSDLSLDRFFFLGNGSLYGMACEVMLKMKEMTCSWAEAYHTLEFRHGPMSIANDQALVVGLMGDTATEQEIKVLKEMKQKGARILALVESKGAYDWHGIDHVVEMKSGLGEWERGALYLPFLQWMAFHRSLAKGLDPDQPVNLSQVIYLE